MANVTRTCSEHECSAVHFAKGLCAKHYYRANRKLKAVQKFATCAWCGASKPLFEMRQPDTDRGKTPSTCYECRSSHPGLAWCDVHMKPHPRSMFTARPRYSIGIENRCIQSHSQKASAARGLADIACVSCEMVLPSWEFRGGRQKARTCRQCADSHVAHRWCLDCKSWRPEDQFHRTGKNNAFHTIRCKPCRSAHSHGVTVEWILKKQGVSSPVCGACGSIDMLQIDHDHSCCDSIKGCPNCVRGYLCHQCNTSEGLLRTAERARMLAGYIERHAAA